MTRLVRKNTAGWMVLTLALVVGMLAGTAQAQTTYTWTKTTGGALDWSTGANWSGGVAPDPISGDTVDFSAADIAANTTLTLGANRTATTWKFGDATTASHDWTVNSGNSIILAGTTPTINVVNRTATLNNVLDGTAGLTKSGTGDLTLSGANTYSGTTTINASGGSLILNNLNAIANSTSVSIASGTSLRFAVAAGGTYATAGTISIAGTGLSTLPNPGALWFGQGGSYGSVLNAPINLTAAATLSSYGNVMTQTLGGSITGTGPLTIYSTGGSATDKGVWTLGSVGNASSYTGNTIFKNGSGLQDITVKLGVINALPVTTSLNLEGSVNTANPFVTFDLNGFDQTLAGLTDSGSTASVANFGKRVINSSGTLSTLTINNAGPVTYGTTGTRITAGTIGGLTAAGVAANNLALTKTGAGTLTLTATASSFTGNILISNGTLSATAGSLGLNPTTSALGNPQTGGRLITIGSAGTLNFGATDVMGNSSSTVVATLVANGGIIRNTGANFNTLGPVQLNGGTLSSFGGYNGSYPSFYLNGTITVGGSAVSTISSTGTDSQMALRTAGTTFDVTDTVSGSDLNVTGVLASWAGGAGALIKTGVGTMTLSGANTFTGQTTVSAGTLQIGAGGTTGTLGSGTVLNNSALSFNRSNQITVANVISGSGTVTHNGAGNLEIMGNNSYTGGTFINSGLLFLRADLGANLGTGTVTVGSSGGANLLIWAPGAVTLANNFVLNGATGVDNRAALNHDGGAGLVTLTGTVTLNATSDIGVGGGSFNNMIISGVVSGAAGAGLIVHERNIGGNNYTLTLSGANTYTGPTTITGGTLKAGVASVANVSGAFGNNSAVTLSNSAGVILDITGFNTQIGSLTGGGASGGNVTLGAATLTVGGDNTSPAGYAGVISGTGGLTKIGTGTQILSRAASSFTGNILISNGRLSATAGGLGLNPTASALGNPQTVGRLITISSAGTLNFGATDVLGDSSSTVVATLVANGGIIRNTGANFNVLGPVQLNGGTLSSFGGYDGNYPSFYLNGTVTVGGSAVSTISSTGVNSQMGLRNAGTTFDVADGSDLNVTGVLANWAGGTGAALIKTGAGTMTLSGTNTYTGDTTVSAGTLLVNGSLASVVTVNSGATLGGSGTIAGSSASLVKNGATLSPGNTVGTLTFSNGLTLDSGSILALGLGTSPDLLRVSGGTFTAPSSGTVQINITNAGGLAAGDYTLINWTSAATSSVEVADFVVTLVDAGMIADASIQGTKLMLTLSTRGTTFRFR